MAFRFPKPVPYGSVDTVSRDEYNLMRHSGPDYDELIIRLSRCAFNRLSPSAQQANLPADRQYNVQGEENEFTELFKKSKCYDDQVRFLYGLLQELKGERLISFFKQLKGEQQERVIKEINAPIIYPLPHYLLRGVKETEEDYRLRRFTRWCTSLPEEAHYKLKVLWKILDDDENNPDWKSCFSEFFVDFSVVWFQGQWASDQDMLIGQLSKELITCVAIEKCLPQEDFKLTRFTELCKKVVDFRVQEIFLDNVLRKLEGWEGEHSCRLILEPQKRDRAAELLSDLSTVGFSLMSPEYQQHKIDEMSKPSRGRLVCFNSRKTRDHSEEAIRMRRFGELFNQVPVFTRIDLLKEFKMVLSEAVVHDEHSAEKLGTKRFSCESEENLGYLCWPEADRDLERVRQVISDYKEDYSPYAEYLFRVSLTWFKARCANYRRNPIHLILHLPTEETEKLPGESEVDFRLRRFTESFNQLQLSSQGRIVKYIQDTLFDDLGFPEPILLTDVVRLGSSEPPSERKEFASEWIKMSFQNLPGPGAATTTPPVASASGSATTTQAGGGIVNRP